MTIPEAFALGFQHHQGGRLGEAEAIYRQILAVDPRHAHALHQLGIVAHQVGRNDAAVELILKAIAVTPNAPAFHSNLGLALAGLRRFDEAIAAYHRTIQLDPNIAEAHYNLGNALVDQGRLDEAIAAYRQAVQLKPAYASAHNNLGNALKDQGQPDEAIAKYHRALELKPDFAEAHYNLGNALREKGHADEAVVAYRQALQFKPNYVDALNNLGNALKDQGQPDEAVAAYRRAIDFKPDSAGMDSNLLLSMHYSLRSDWQTMSAESSRWNRMHGRPLAKSIRPHANVRDQERRLRVGYVSPDFFSGPIVQFLLPLLENHDRSGFEIFCYASVQRPDSATERLRKTADVWRDVLGKSDEALACGIRQDGIDLLVDLTLHGAHNRLLAFARKPAPVQIAWLGHPGGTGLEAMDYRLTDAWMEPEGSEWSRSIETAVRMPDSWFCFDPLDEYPAPGELPARRGGHVTFGCLNNFGKVNDAVLHRWAGVMQAVEGSKLLLQCPEGETRLRVCRLLESHGIAPGRVEMFWRMPRSEFLGLFGRIDIALDPFPYNGGTTTCEALWMGIPVLTLPGETIVSRIGLSILSAAGVPEFVAHSETEYVRLAASLAGNLPRLAHLRGTLRERMRASPFMDAPRFARNVERAYRQMWRAWCAKQSPPPAAG